jgi:sugar phosphate isomerase/epimerase
MNNPIILHVNYVEQGQQIEEMCKKAAAWGYDGIEFRSSKEGYSTEKYVSEIAKCAAASRLQHVLFSIGPELMTDNPDERQRSLDESVDFLTQISKHFKPSVLNAFAGNLLDSSAPYNEYDKHGSAIASDEQWQWAAEAYKTLGDLASGLGFKLALETHMCYIHDSHISAKKLVDMVDRESVGINLDYCNILNFEEQPALAEVIETCGDKLYYVHLKNMMYIPDRVYNKAIRCPLGDGIINNREFLKLLREKGYNGAICLEAPRAGDREWFAQEDLAYIKSVINDLSIFANELA